MPFSSLNHSLCGDGGGLRQERGQGVGVPQLRSHRRGREGSGGLPHLQPSPELFLGVLVACLGLAGKGSHQVFFGLSSCVFRFFHGGYSFLLFCFYCSKSMIFFCDEVTFLFILDDLVCSYPAA